MISISQKQFYNRINPQYLRYEINKPYASYLVRKIVNLLNKTKALNVLEIGAGQGRFSIELTKHVNHLTATDISQNELNLLEKLKKTIGIKNITVEEIDIRKRNSKHKHKYDAIVGFHVLHHISKKYYFSVADNIKNMIKKDGCVSFIEPNNLYPFHIVEMLITKDMEWRIEKGIYSDYIGSFKKACKAKGLKLTICRKFGFFPPPIINKFPWVIKLDRIIEKIPLFNQFFCPFILVSFQKEG
jgi:2-polyprenyl-3-methyl-5-hydroxy-6-metoxy-1,4-benzoquinol methylase